MRIVIGADHARFELKQKVREVLRNLDHHAKKRDGYVSLEVSPLLAHNTRDTLAEARRLWQAVGRDNLMIKVPATPEGIPAIEQLIEDLEAAHATMETLAQVGISMEAVTAKLLEDGVGLFAEAFDKLLSAVNKHCQTSGAVVAQAVA